MAIATAVPAGSPDDGTAAQVPSPLQKVEEEALVPLFKLLIPRLPVIDEAPKSIANSVDSITRPPLALRSVLNSVPVKSKPSPAV